MERLVFTRFIGGLGNQLFQYAAGQAAAHKVGGRLIVDARYVPEPELLRQFGVEGIETDIEHMPPHKSSRLRYLAWRTLDQSPKILREAKTHTWGQAFPKGDFYLHGYWQRREIVEASGLHIERPSNVEVPSRAANEVCVHVRGGDYLTIKSLDQHATLDGAYYKAGVRALLERLGEVKITVFTNDIAHAKSLDLDFDYTFADPALERDAITSLWAMAQFQNFVIANSTFSWWASYLAGSGAQVIEPPELLVK